MPKEPLALVSGLLLRPAKTGPDTEWGLRARGLLQAGQEVVVCKEDPANPRGACLACLKLQLPGPLPLTLPMFLYSSYRYLTCYIYAH